MKKTLLIGLAAMLMSCNLLAESETQNREVAKFSGIDARNGIKVNVVQGTAESVKVTANADYINDLITEVESGTLVIRWDNKVKIKSRNATVDVVATDLNRIVASSGAFVKTDTIKADMLKLASSSGARLEVGGVSASRIDVGTSSGASVEVSGKAEQADLDASSGARIKGSKLSVSEAKASASSGASISVNVSDNFSADASSGGSIRYGGKPQFSDVKASSGGSISKL
ncbi:MAG: DUF2807 domain-containing protein [Salinivirgaceae bacterium]|nr:DUF2807 domain-containing protein [Salinivirgaceae bacterium]